MCQKEDESVNHLFLHCEVAASIWVHFLQRCGVSWTCPEKITEAAESWLGDYFVGCVHSLWRMLLSAILWSIWKERNNRIFKGTFSSLSNLVDLITMRIAGWALIRKEFSNFSIDDITVNWEACMGCGPSKMRIYVHWSPSPIGMLKFNVDGAARGKPGPASIGGVLRNSRGEVLFMFSKSVGVCDSNKAEVLAILEALQYFSRFFNGILVVESDSMWLLGCPIVRLILGSFNFSVMRFGSYPPRLMLSSFMCLDR
eukprot:TRINITY_DN9427_c0_g3_i1.p1 TRINITY_DN9427_c0_g3~~TRINITY_DN9427_c0_g3_i1.p1  ORF type:complete len:256 (+),score=22.30 TRINITY_DN9427_c0_g3_i1:1157-1924(+)